MPWFILNHYSDERHPRPGTKRPRDEDEEEDLNDINFDEVHLMQENKIFSLPSLSPPSSLAMGVVCLRLHRTKRMIERQIRFTTLLTIVWTVDERLDERRSFKKILRSIEQRDLRFNSSSQTSRYVYNTKECLLYAVTVFLSLTLVQRALVDVSDDDWNNIPEVGDARNKKQRNAHIRPDRYTPIPDSVLQRAMSQGSSHNSLDTRQQVSWAVAMKVHPSSYPPPPRTWVVSLLRTVEGCLAYLAQ